jgi:hypothetical protein
MPILGGLCNATSFTSCSHFLFYFHSFSITFDFPSVVLASFISICTYFCFCFGISIASRIGGRVIFRLNKFHNFTTSQFTSIAWTAPRLALAICSGDTQRESVRAYQLICILQCTVEKYAIRLHIDASKKGPSKYPFETTNIWNRKVGSK